MKPDLNDEVARILMKAIERDRTLRFNTATQFKEALQHLPKQDY